MAVRRTCRPACDANVVSESALVQRVQTHPRTGLLVSSWQATEDGLDLLLARERYRRLHESLFSGRLKVRVVARNTSNVFVHGKAGVIEHANGRVYSFVGSVNVSASGFRHAYEILWGDEDPGAATWVRDEFEHFWRQGVDLPDAVVKHGAAMAGSSTVRSRTRGMRREAFRSVPSWRSGPSTRAARSCALGRSASCRTASRTDACMDRRGS